MPHVTIPVRPGRDLARLIEVAAMDQKLKSLGSNAALEFNTKLLNLMEKKESRWDCLIEKLVPAPPRRKPKRKSQS